MQIDFQKCYTALNLEAGADWQDAQDSYRRLVHEWHPDRHNTTPADNHHAQLYFIELTRSFDAIRKYYRRYKRMPLLRNLGSTATVGTDHFSNSESLLNKARNREQNMQMLRRNNLKKHAILALGAGLGLAVLFFLFSLDRQLAVQASEDAKRELQNSTPSRFQKSQTEINRAEAKGAFIVQDPAGGALGQDGALFEQN